MVSPTSKLWVYFVKRDSELATCKECLKEVKYSGNTANLSKHLLQNHPKLFDESDKEKPSSSSSCLPSSTCKSSDATNVEVRDKMSIEAQPSTSTGQLLSPMLDVFKKPFKHSESGVLYGRIVSYLLFFICKDNRPFDLINGEGFKRLLKELAPSFKIPSVKFFKKELDLKYEAVAHRLKQRIAEAPNLCLTMDVWTEKLAQKSFLGVTVHFLKEVNICSVSLATAALDSSNTVDYLKQVIKGILSQWGIQEKQITSIVTDNGINMVAAVNGLFENRPNIQLSCFAHTLNLVVESVNAIPSVESHIKKVQNIIKYLKNSTKRSDNPRNTQLENNNSGRSVKKITLQIRTRRNSTYHMLSKYLEKMQVISQILKKDPNSPDMLTASEIEELNQLVALLKAFDYVAKDMLGEKYTSVSKVIPMVNCVMSHLESFEGTTMKDIKDAKDCLLMEMKRKFGQIEEVPTIAIATVLDPRFKDLHFKDPKALFNALSTIREALKDGETTLTSGESEKDKSTENFDFWKTHKELAHEYGKKKKRKTTDNDELSLYLDGYVSPLDCNPLEVWEEMRTIFPKLYKLARMYLINMATSVPDERLFPKPGATSTERKSRLSSGYLEKLIFLGSIAQEDWN